jgi:hypothetical protein
MTGFCEHCDEHSGCVKAEVFLISNSTGEISGSHGGENEYDYLLGYCAVYRPDDGGSKDL